MAEMTRLSRRVPLAVMVTLGLQTAAGLMWAGAAEQRLAAVEHVIDQRANVRERLARVETSDEAIKAQLTRIEAKLDALGARRGGRDG